MTDPHRYPNTGRAFDPCNDNHSIAAGDSQVARLLGGLGQFMEGGEGGFDERSHRAGLHAEIK